MSDNAIEITVAWLLNNRLFDEGLAVIADNPASDLFLIDILQLQGACDMMTSGRAIA